MLFHSSLFFKVETLPCMKRIMSSSGNFPGSALDLGWRRITILQNSLRFETLLSSTIPKQGAKRKSRVEVSKIGIPRFKLVLLIALVLSQVAMAGISNLSAFPDPSRSHGDQPLNPGVGYASPNSSQSTGQVQVRSTVRVADLPAPNGLTELSTIPYLTPKTNVQLAPLVASSSRSTAPVASASAPSM